MRGGDDRQGAAERSFDFLVKMITEKIRDLLLQNSMRVTDAREFPLRRSSIGGIATHYKVSIQVSL
jgi:hypothetical protein